MYAAASAAENAAGSESNEDPSADSPKPGDEDVVDAEVIDDTEDDTKDGSSTTGDKK